MRWRSWVIITPPKRDDPIYPSKAPHGFSAAERLRSTPVFASCSRSGGGRHEHDRSGIPQSIALIPNHRPGAKLVMSSFQAQKSVDLDNIGITFSHCSENPFTISRP